jgi:SM-20-related protein
MLSYLDQINSSLEEKSWFYQENFLQGDLCKAIVDTFLDKKNKRSFIEAKIGAGIRKNEVNSIRNSSIQWIDSWDENLSMKTLNIIFSEIFLSTRDYFRLPIKRHESQFAIYEKGGFYKTHLDQHKHTRHRQISTCLYLNDCIEGGELILYKKGSKTEIEKVIKPSKGSFVIFFSADIYHEVKLVKSPRFSISTWYRDDEIIPFI